MRRTLILALALLAGGCSMVDRVNENAPPPEYGRPGYVRGMSRVGSWVGAVVGGVGSVLLLPITYPIALIDDEPFGASRDEFLWGGVAWGASAGHFVFGAPVDLVDWTVRRAWTEEENPAGYEVEAAAPPIGPGPGDMAADEPLVPPVDGGDGPDEDAGR